MDNTILRRFVALDSLRGVAATIVAFSHFTTGQVLAGAYLCVDFFFVLSGFVIAASYGDKLKYGFSVPRFMFLRLGRLYPLHIFVLLCSVVLINIGPLIGLSVSHDISEAYSLSSFIKAALLLQTFTTGNLGGWNPPSWSISAEVWTYLIFAILWRFTTAYTMAIAMACIIAVAPIAMLYSTHRYLDACFEGGLARCLFGFSFGVIGYSLWSAYGGSLKAMSAISSTIAETVAFGVCAILVVYLGISALSFLCPPIALLTVLIFAREGGLLSRLLVTAPFRLLGAISYSIYMTHMFIEGRVVNVIKKLGLPVQVASDGFSLSSNLAVAVAVLIIIIASYFTFTLLEEPFRKWSRRVEARTRSPDPVIVIDVRIPRL